MNMHNTQGHTMLWVMQTHTEIYLCKNVQQYICVHPFAIPIAAIKFMSLILLMISITHTHLQEYYYIFTTLGCIKERKARSFSWVFALSNLSLALSRHLCTLHGRIWQFPEKMEHLFFASLDQRVPAWWEYVQKHCKQNVPDLRSYIIIRQCTIFAVAHEPVILHKCALSIGHIFSCSISYFPSEEKMNMASKLEIMK